MWWNLAEPMGTRGFLIDSPYRIAPVLRAAMAADGPVLVGVPVDYRDNASLMTALHPDVLHYGAGVLGVAINDPEQR